MSLIKASTDISDLSDEDMKKYIQLFLQECQNVVNGKIEFLKNMVAKSVAVTFPLANTNQSVAHGLGFVPNGYIITKRSVDLTVYDGTDSATTTTISLKSGAVGTANILFF